MPSNHRILCRPFSSKRVVQKQQFGITTGLPSPRPSAILNPQGIEAQCLCFFTVSLLINNVPLWNFPGGPATAENPVQQRRSNTADKKYIYIKKTYSGTDIRVTGFPHTPGKEITHSMLTKGTLNDTEQGGHLIILPTTCCKSACLYQQYESIMLSHFCDPMDHGPPGSSVHEVLQPRILEWVAMPPPGDLPDPGIEPASPASPALQEDSLSLSHHESP